MKSTGLLIAAIILAALSGTLYWLDHRKPAPFTAASSEPPKVLSFKDADAAKIDIKSKTDVVSLAKNASGQWLITAPKPLPADQDSVSSMVSALSSLNSDRLVDDKPSDLAQYGLTDPSLEIDVTYKDNKTQKLLIGDNTPTNNGAFAKLESDPRVFTIATYTRANINKSANDLRDKRLLTSNFDKISQIELIAKKQDIAFGRDKQQWQIVKPKPLRADDFQVEELQRKLKEAKMDLGSSAPDEKKIASAFAAATPVATAKVTDSSGTQELQVRKNKDDYYAKSSAVPGVYKVTSDLGQGLDKSVDDFRSKKLFDFGFDDPNKIEVHDVGKSYLLTRSGENWSSADGKKMDLPAVQSLIDKLRYLTSTKFPDSGFTTPTVDATVTSGDGKRVEQVQIAKVGDRYIARRANEPALYEIDPAGVTDIEKAAADLKPAAPETNDKKK